VRAAADSAWAELLTHATDAELVELERILSAHRARSITDLPPEEAQTMAQLIARLHERRSNK
jgi:hypothetical protein